MKFYLLYIYIYTYKSFFFNFFYLVIYFPFKITYHIIQTSSVSYCSVHSFNQCNFLKLASGLLYDFSFLRFLLPVIYLHWISSREACLRKELKSSFHTAIGKVSFRENMFLWKIVTFLRTLHKKLIIRNLHSTKVMRQYQYGFLYSEF